jgi:cold shock protein
MANGKIKRLNERGFGFIETEAGKDMFFHKSNVEGAGYETLQVGQPVSFTEGRSEKGPQAENVKVI